MSAIGALSVCRSVRAQVSLRLDSELSQLETRMLEVHLGRCASCSEYAADVERFTADLRSAPLEPLVRPAFVERGRRRLAHARLQGGAVAAAFAIVGTSFRRTGGRVASNFIIPFFKHKGH